MMGPETEHLSHQPDDFTVKSLDKSLAEDSHNNTEAGHALQNGSADSAADQSRDITALRERLRNRINGTNGKRYWKSLDDIADRNSVI